MTKVLDLPKNYLHYAENVHTLSIQFIIKPTYIMAIKSKN
jgi:hypothetical protein